MDKQKKWTGKRVLLLIAELFFLALFLVAAVRLGKMAYDYYKGDQLYQQASDAFLKEESPSTDNNVIDLGISVDFDALTKTNADAIGWILIPDTAVNYPLMQTENNQYYLKHTYNGTYSDFGSIFLATECGSDFSDQHSLIYGHNTKNGSMFGSLKKYKDKAYLEAHPYLYIIQKDQILEYKIISAFTAETSDDIYLLSFASDGDYFYWLQRMVALSEVEAAAPKLSTDTKVLTLSTCTSRTETERFTVNAVLNHVYSTVNTAQ